MGTAQAATMCPFVALWDLRTPVQLMEVGAAEIVAHPPGHAHVHGRLA